MNQQFHCWVFIQEKCKPVYKKAGPRISIEILSIKLKTGDYLDVYQQENE